MKSPAFQFYAADFLEGTADMTAEEVGVYVRLLCHSWTKDGLDDNDRLALLAGQCQASSLAHAKTKFSLIGGKLRNQRQEEERKKQSDFRTRQAVNGAKRWSGNAKPDAKPVPSHEGRECSPSPSPSPSCLERESHQPEVTGKPTLKEVLTKAEFIGLAPWKAEDWWNEMEGCGWLDHAHRPICRWDAILIRVKAKWEADDRPKSPPSAKGKSNGKPAWTPPTHAP